MAMLYLKRFFVLSILTTLSYSVLGQEFQKKKFIGIGFTHFDFVDPYHSYIVYNQAYLDYEYRFHKWWFYNASIAYEIIHQEPHGTQGTEKYIYAPSLTLENSINTMLGNYLSVGVGISFAQRFLECRRGDCNDPLGYKFSDAILPPQFFTPFGEISFYTPMYRGFAFSLGLRYSTGHFWEAGNENYGFTSKIIYNLWVDKFNKNSYVN